MSPRMRMLLAAALVLLAANIIKWSFFSGGAGARDKAVYNEQKLVINFQKPGTKQDAKVIRDLFDGEEAGYRPVVRQTEQVNTPVQATATAVPEVKWPEFKISGVAVNDGRKCAFFSGRAFSGAVYEGSIIVDNYTLAVISGGNAEIVNNTTGEKRNFPLEEK